VIDNQPYGDRRVFMLEQPHRLPHAVLVNFEILLTQIGNNATFPVAYGSVQDD
jgi:hypothetical protein